jgi:hypothetical protein
MPTPWQCIFVGKVDGWASYSDKIIEVLFTR